MTPTGGARGATGEAIGRREAGRVLRRTLRLLRPYRPAVAVACLVMVASTAAVLAGPALVRHAIDRGVRHRSAAVLNRDAAAYLALAVAALALGRAQVWAVANVGERLLRDLRVRVFDHLLGLSMDFFGTQPAGRLVARMTSDIEALTELVQTGLVLFVTNALLLAGSVAAVLALSPRLAAVCLLALPVVVVASARFRRSSNRAYLVYRDRIAQTMSSLQEGLTGVRVTQAFAREDATERRFRERNRAQLAANMDTARISSYYFPVVELAGVATTAAAVGVGGMFVHDGTVTVGTVAAFVLYLGNLFEPVQQLSQLFNTLQSAGAALHKLFGLLDVAPSVTERPGAVDLPATGPLVAEGVSFTYDGTAPVLEGVDLTVAPGERVALIGPTGAGKSTLAKLLARLYDPSAGRVCFGGVDLRHATLRSLRERIVLVPQEGFLFAGTIRDNVRIGRPGADDAEVEAALASIGVLGHFQRFPEGLDTEVRERGSRLSAGERQLISLARAALADPAVLILDEATSSLDPGTEAQVEAAMEALTAGRSVVVIAHRMSTAARADRVLQVEAGRVTDLGPPALAGISGGWREEAAAPDDA